MKKIKFILVLFIALMLFNIGEVYANDGGASGNSGTGNAGDQFSDSSVWPYAPGSTESFRGIRVTVVDKSGNVKSGSVSADFVRLSEYSSSFTATRTLQKTVKTSYINKGITPTWSKGNVSVFYDANVASMITRFGAGNVGNMGEKIINLYNNYKKYKSGVVNDTTKIANYIITKIYEKTGAGLITRDDVIIFEPTTYVKINGEYLYGTAYELAKKYNSCTSANAGSVITKYLPEALFFSGDKISPLMDTFVEPSTTTYSCSNDNITKTNGWGMGALWIGGTAPTCDINNNNNGNATNSDTNYWTYYDANCNDGAGCWKKIKNGCCDTYSSKTNYTSAQVLAKYPECATCNVKNQLYIDNVKVENLDSLECKDKAVTITNYKGTGSLTEVTSDICLANNKLYSGITKSGKKYGCEIKDSLTLPKEYDGILMIGQKFVWPTSNTIKRLGYFDNSYPTTRKTEIKCIAYTYEKDGIKGNFSYLTLTDSELKEIEKNFTVSESLKLKYEGNDNGKIVKEKNKKTKAKNGTKFSFNIDVAYTLNKVDKTNGAYAYLNLETLKYMNKFILTNRYKYYRIPVIPFGNYGDKNVSIDYGIDFSSMSVMGKENDKFAGSYVCDRNDEKTGSDLCKCPLGTKYEGKILTPDENNWVASCATLMDSECDDSDDPIKCPNDAEIDITSCVLNNEEGADLTQETSYDACVAVRCEGPPPPPCEGEHCYPEPPIYRTIFLNNPFLKENGEKRLPGANWGGKYSVDSNGNYIGLVNKYIISTKDYMYEGEAMYSFTLTPEILRTIKDYNKGKEYSDFKLDCDNDGFKCYSLFLHNNLEKTMTGTCGSIKGKTEFQDNFNKCRLDSFEK